VLSGTILVSCIITSLRECYQFLILTFCPYEPFVVGSRVRSSSICSRLLSFVFFSRMQFSNTVYSRMRMGSSCATMGARSLFCVSQGAVIWSPIRSSDHQRQQTSPGSGLPTCKTHRWEPPACPAGISRHREEQHGVSPRRLPNFVQLCARCRDPYHARSPARLSEQYSCCHRYVLFSGFPLDMPAAMRHVCLG